MAYSGVNFLTVNQKIVLKSKLSTHTKKEFQGSFDKFKYPTDNN